MGSSSIVVTLKGLFRLSSPPGLSGGGFWFQARKPADLDKPYARLHAGGVVKCKALEFRVTGGRKLTDVVGNSFMLLIVSGRLTALFRERGLTGWRTFPVRLFDRNDVRIKEDYCGLGITGRAGRLDTKRSVTEWFVRSDGTKSILSMKGLYFDVRKWDGSILAP